MIISLTKLVSTLFFWSHWHMKQLEILLYFLWHDIFGSSSTGHHLYYINWLLQFTFLCRFLLKFQYLVLSPPPFTPATWETYLCILLTLSCGPLPNYILSPGISNKVQILYQYFSFHLNISLWMAYWHHNFNIPTIKCMISPTNKQQKWTKVYFSPRLLFLG